MGLGLLTGTLGARLLGPSGRGQLAAIQLWPMTAVALGSGGLQEAMVYYCGRHREQSRRIATTSIVLLLAISPVLMVLGYLVMPRLLAAEPATVVRQAQLYMVIVPVLFVVFAGLNVLRALSDFRVWNSLRLALPAGYACVLLFAIPMHAHRVTWVAFGYFGWAAVLLILAVWIFRHRLHGTAGFDTRYVRPLTRCGALSVSANAPASLNQRLDQMVIGAFLPPRLLGLYAVGVTWSMAVTPLSNAFSQVILPRLAGAHDAREAGERLCRASRVVAAATGVVALVLLAVSPVAVRLLFGPAFVPAIPTTLVLVLAAALFGMNTFYEEALRGLGRPGLAATAEFAGLFVTVPALYLLLPRAGILGAAIASFLAYGTVLGALVGLLWTRAGLRPGRLFVMHMSDTRELISRGQSDV